MEQTDRDIKTLRKQHRRYSKTNNQRSACDTHILDNKHEYGPRHKSIKLTKPCSKSKLMNCWENSYASVSTTIEYKGTFAEIPLKRGVKQGDPLSPFIFNAIMDPLLMQLEEMKGNEICENKYISTLAFADDLILLANTNEKSQSLLSYTEDYLSSLGMRIAAIKSTSFQIKPTKESWYIIETHLQLNSGETIPASEANNTLCYLGGNISPWYGIRHNDVKDQLQSTLERCRSVYLKPHQKLSLINTYIIPHYINRLVMDISPISTIRNMDQIIRNNIKSILHLPVSTPDGLIYCSKRDGGLGTPKLETLIPCAALKQGLTLLNTIDPIIHELFKSTNLEKRLLNMARTLKIAWPIVNFRQIDLYKKRQKEEDVKRWSRLRSKGKGVD
jgi:hypothetical protein